MSNVVSFRPAAVIEDGFAALINGIASNRRGQDDVFWLKENAELLGVLAATEASVDPSALAPFEDFYAQLEERLRFFPQYYRFLLSICLDLEDLGMPGAKGAALCDWAARRGLAEAELSDLQRAEARRLLARRGAARAVGEGGLGRRLHGFIDRSGTFAMPNKKAAYELTHILFYLSEYGRRDPQVSAEAITSLEFAGLLAYLDQNIDLLAEVCTALRFAGQTPSAIWEEAVVRTHQGMSAVDDAAGDLNDPYHEYLVTGWAVEVAGGRGFGRAVPQGALRFRHAGGGRGALRTLSECMFGLGATRSGDWQRMRGHVLSHLDPEGHDLLNAAERSSSKFEAFFEGFARAGTV